jgi:hypothetical protein
MGTVSAVVFGGCMTLATVVGAGVIFPSLRKLDLEEDIAKAKASETVS